MLAPGSRCAIAAYRRRNAWLDPRDLEQEAALVALEAGRDWRPDGGTTRDLWEAWRVGLALSRIVAETRCPVSLPKRKGESWDAASASVGASLTVQAPDGGERERPALEQLAADQHEDAESVIDRARAVVAVRRIMASQPPAARAVLLDEERPAAVAARLGMTPTEVYRATCKATRRLRAALRIDEEQENGLG